MKKEGAFLVIENREIWGLPTTERVSELIVVAVERARESDRELAAEK